MRKAIKKLKKKITNEPVMRLPDLLKPFEVTTDVSQYVIGGVLTQTDEDGNQHPVWYVSRSCTGTERKHSMQKERCWQYMIG